MPTTQIIPLFFTNKQTPPESAIGNNPSICTIIRPSETCYNTGVSAPQDEAIDILKGVLDNLFSGNVDLKTVLRRCAHVCQMLNWGEQLSWFQNELYGYPSGVELPWYRKAIRGRRKWRVTGGIYTVLDSVIEDEHSTKKEPITYTTIDIRTGIDWILSAAQSGYVESTSKKSSKHIRFRHKDVETEEVDIYDEDVFQTILTNIENLAFNFASSSYPILQYGDALQDVWQAYRARVEESLVPIGFAEHLDTVRNGLNSQNPQYWRAAMWSCRDILHDLAVYLWRDQRETYEHLPGQGKGGKLRVTESDYVNRLGAYLHQKGVVGKMGAYLRAEMERIYHSISTLNELDSKAHSEVTLFDVRTAAIGTYTILGEIVTRTDMKPVIEYCSPQISEAAEQ